MRGGRRGVMDRDNALSESIRPIAPAPKLPPVSLFVALLPAFFIAFMIEAGELKPSRPTKRLPPHAQIMLVRDGADR